MTEAFNLEPESFFDFVGAPKPSVVFLSVHPAHKPSRALLRHLNDKDGNPIPLGAIGLMDLATNASPVLAYLHHGLQSCGIRSMLQILPGYYLFHGGQLLGWHLGLPAKQDTPGIVRGSLLGAIVSAFTKNISYLGMAFTLAAEESAGQRIGEMFRELAAEYEVNPRPPPTRSPKASATEVAQAYNVLGVTPNCTDAEVESAWRQRRRDLHPDLAAGDPDEFERRTRLSVQLNHAREVIRQHRSRTR